jgi:protein TonB
VAATKPRVLKSSTPSAVAPQADQQTRPIVVIPPDDDFAAGAYDQKTPGFTFPQVLREVKPRYSMDAMRAKLQGTVAIEAIVSVDGRVEKARVIRSLDSVWGLDEEALTAARGWVFTPARVNGEIVRARIILELEFRLH